MYFWILRCTKKELFMKRMDEGIMGSGYDWEKVASILRQEARADFAGERYILIPNQIYFVHMLTTARC